MIAGAVLSAAGAVRTAFGWGERHGGYTLEPRLGALFAFFRLVAVRGQAAPTPAALRRATVRTPKLFGTRAQRSVATQEVTIPGDPPLAARSYLPPDGGGPTLLYFHGGGFVVGDLGTHDPICRTLAALGGVRVVSVAYRLAPEHPFPAAVDDALRAYDWAAASGRVGVGGDSAGANLAAVVAQARRHAPASPLLQFLLYPVVDMAAEIDRPLPRGPLLDERLLRWFGAQYLPPGQDPGDPRLSPARAADLSGLCPALVVTAGFDPLQPQGLAYAEALRAAGVAVEQVDHPTLAHGFADFAGVVPAARAALDDAARRLGAMCLSLY